MTLKAQIKTPSIQTVNYSYGHPVKNLEKINEKLLTPEAIKKFSDRILSNIEKDYI